MERKSLAIITVSILSLAILGNVIKTAPNAFAQSAVDDQDVYVKYAANSEMIKGHMAKAVENKEKNDLELAKAHAGHPIAEHYSILESEVNEHNAQLNTQLKDALNGLAGRVDAQSAADFKAETERISKMLDQAYSDVISETKRNDIKFNANVIIALVSQAGQEYGEGIKDGKVVAEVEYQDAQAFSTRAHVFFDQVSANLTAHEKDNAAGFFKDLEASMNSHEDVDKVQSEIAGVINEVREGAGIQASATNEQQQVDAVQHIQIVRDLLKQVSADYHQGNYTGADKVTVVAYLDHIEPVETALINHDAKDLKLELEQMMRIQLRDMIKQKAAPEQVDNHIAAINTKLDQAVKVVPEFPVEVLVAMASVIGVVIAITRRGNGGSRIPGRI